MLDDEDYYNDDDVEDDDDDDNYYYFSQSQTRKKDTIDTVYNQSQKKDKDYLQEKHLYDFNISNYGNHEEEPIEIPHIPLLSYVSWMSLIPKWFGNLDFNFETGPLNENTKITRFTQTEFIRKHLIYEYDDMIAELDNKTIIYKGSLIYDEISPNVLYWVKDIVQCLKPELKQHCTNSYASNVNNNVQRSWLLPLTFVHVDRIQKISNIGWCITQKNCYLQIKQNSKVKIAKKVHHKDVKFCCQESTQQNGSTVFTETQIHAPKFQDDLVKKKGMYLFVQWSTDGVPVKFAGRSVNNSYFNIANSNLGKININLWRQSVTPSTVPMRYLLQILCQQLKKTRIGFGLWTCSDDLQGFQKRQCKISLNAIVTDSADRVKFQLSPKSHSLNASNGKTFINAALNGPPWPHGLDHLRKFNIQIPYKYKKTLHCYLHSFAHKQWNAFPNKGISKQFMVSNSPWEYWKDLQGNKFEWNFLQLGITEIYHTTSIGLNNKLFSELYRLFHFRNLRRTYTSLRNHIYDTNDTLKQKSIADFDKLTKQTEMNKVFCKWFYICATLPTICQWKEGIDDVVHLNRLLCRILLTDTEKERKNICNQAKLLLNKLFKQYKESVNTPKFRFLKEILDFDLYLFGAVSLIEGIYTERGHQWMKKLIKFRSNNSKKNLTDIMTKISYYFGLIYSLNGGHWGSGLQNKIGSSALNLKHPSFELRNHPFLEEFLFPEFNELFNEFNDNDEYKQSKKKRIIIQTQNNAIQNWWDKFVVGRNDRELEQLINYGFEDNFNHHHELIATKCSSIIIDDGKKSNQVIFSKSKPSWNYWFKVIPKHNDYYNLPHAMNIKYILNIEHNFKNRYFAFGDIYPITTATQYDNYHKNKDYANFLDTFNRDEPLTNRKWIEVTDETVLESIVVVHKHIQQTQNFSINLQQHMTKNYSTQIHNNQSYRCIPCGPILKCNTHDKPYCISCKNENKKLRSSWWCNTQQSTLGQNNFVIWDAKNGWLPGLWQHLHPNLRNKYFIQCKPPQNN